MSLPSYNINWLKFITESLHPLRRTPKRVALIKALIKRIIDVHAEFVATHSSQKEKVKWAGQTILLERLLQLKYGMGLSIENIESYGTVQIEFEADNISNPITFVAPEFTNPLYGLAGDGALGYGFKVLVPAAYVFSQDEMRAIIDKYLINYKNYSIEII